jgi:hypothetical protein
VIRRLDHDHARVGHWMHDHGADMYRDGSSGRMRIDLK